jgi:prepilin-type N-terminal cleavage/methylation domain-containing protein
MRAKRRDQGFSLVEISITSAIVGILGTIIYPLMSEALTGYVRNYSENKAYTDARQAVDRIAASLESAGHTPILVDATGAPVNTTPAEGIRYYRYDAYPRYSITGGLLPTQTTISLTVRTGQAVPVVGNIITIGTIGFQAYVTNVVLTGSTATLTCSNISSTGLPTTISANCPTTPSTATLNGVKTALLFTRVAAIVATDARKVRQLRFYPQAMSVATDGAAAFDDPRNYQVLATLPSTPATPQQGKPFQIEQNSLVRASLSALVPDYSNLKRLSPSVLYAVTSTSLGSRCPNTLVRAPY